MRKALSVLVFPVLLIAVSDHAAAQATGTKSQPSANLRTPKEPVRSPSVVLPPSPERVAEARKFYEEGLKLTEEGQYAQAAESLQQAVRLNSEFADAYSALGRTYFKMRLWQKAIDNLRRAGELNTKHRQAQEARSQELQMQKPQASKTPENAKPSDSLSRLQNNNNTAGVNAFRPAPQPTPQPKLAAPETKPQAPNATADASALRSNSPIEPAAPKTVTSQPQSTPGVNAVLPESKPTPQAPPPQVIPKDAAPAPTPTTASSQQPPTLAKQTIATVQSSAPQKFEKASVASLKTEGGNGLSLEANGERVAMNVTPSSELLSPNSVTPSPARPSTDDTSLTKIYRVGPNDVLDVRVNDSQSPKSTLFTITPSGLLEHPLLVEPLMVTGLTVEEIGTRIEDDLKTRALIENPKVIVGVRDYGSHSIIVSGLVKDSGTKFLMREAIPLYVVVADAQPLPEAAIVTVVRNELNQIFEIDLTRAADMNLLVRPGDVITFQPNVTQFVYIGGEVKIPGEKTFRRGLTLTQVILSAGGVTSKSTLAQIARDDGRGFLVETSFKLKDIVSGKTVDPVLKPGDRISILH